MQQLAPAPPAAMSADDLIRAQAIIQSLERMCTESRTRELHKDASNAVLQDLLQKAQREIAELKKQIAASAPQPPETDASKAAGKGRNGKAAHA